MKNFKIRFIAISVSLLSYSMQAGDNGEDFNQSFGSSVISNLTLTAETEK
jgi:hypothetical protein